ncbi:MAG: T9SS type A sorting domain-containing protein [Bacteroidales bacterium]|nr:T9SS type A sorting domain-containing protein [Bacteroidales bacterium]
MKRIIITCIFFLILLMSWAQEEAVKPGVDTLHINSGRKWLSFPRLERYGNEYAPSIPLLERLNCFPCPIDMHYEDPNIYDNWIKYIPASNEWIGGLEAIQSTKGYKLDIESSIETVELDLYGAKVDPETEMTIYSGQENWLGYFLEYPQKIESCIPKYVWNDLTMILTQYWSMKRISSGTDEWFIKGKVTPVDYGDMVILKTNAQHTFAWLDSGEQEEDEEIPKTQFYEYEEQADYLPIFVEFDETSDVQEVAVTADGEVKGAAVKFPGDTIVHICGYLEGVPPDTPLEFETYNGYKSAPVDEKDYIVYNRFSKKKEKRKIYAGESTDFQWVSLKQGEAFEIPDVISDVSCHPNPFTERTLITYRINKTIDVLLEIYDITGKKVKTIVNGEHIGGYYKTEWTGDNDSGSKVNKGIYFYKIRTGNGIEVTDKIVIL